MNEFGIRGLVETMDLFLHFFISFGLTSLLLLLLFSHSLSLRYRVPRFWQTEKAMIRSSLTIAITLSVLIAIAFGIGKEIVDSLGWGHVELKDICADLAGVWIGVYLVFQKVKKQFKRKRSVSFHSTAQMRTLPRNCVHKNVSKER